MLFIGVHLTAKFRPVHVPRCNQRVPVNEEIAMCQDRVEVTLDVEPARHVRLGDHKSVNRGHCVKTALVPRNDREFGVSLAEDVLFPVRSADSKAGPALRPVKLFVPLPEFRDYLIDSRAHDSLHWVLAALFNALTVVSKGNPDCATV